MSQHPDVLILGGGVIGLTVAYYLAREKVSAAVVDKGDFGREASWAGAGILPPGNPARPAPPSIASAPSAAAFPGLSEELRERTGVDNGYLRCGGLELLDGPEDPDDQEWRGDGIRCEAAGRGRPAPPGAQPGPGFVKGFYLPDTAQLRNPATPSAGRRLCGAGSRPAPGCPSSAWSTRPAASAPSPRPRADSSRDTTSSPPGRGATRCWRRRGGGLGVRPVRGQIALLNTACTLFRHVLMLGKRYLVPRPDGRVLIGATEEDAGFDKRTTAAAIRDLLDLGIRLVPGLGGAPLERSWAGLRPGSPDGLPFLGPVPGVENLSVAAGHFRAGIQLSPGTATVMTEVLLGRPTSVPLDAFRLGAEGRYGGAASRRVYPAGTSPAAHPAVLDPRPGGWNNGGRRPGAEEARWTRNRAGGFG